MQDLQHGMRRALKDFFLSEVFRDHMQADRGGDGNIRLVGANATITLSADQFRIDRENGRLQLGNVDATVSESENDMVRHYHSNLAVITLHDGFEPHKPVIQIELKDDVSYTVVGDDAPAVRKPKETLPSIGFHEQPEMQSAFEAYDQTQVLSPDFALPIYENQKKVRAKLVEEYEKYRSEIRGEIHFRSSIAVATIGMVLIGAMLGIILRSGQVLTAIFISCIPGMLVLIACLVARNFADRPAFGLAAVGILWGTTAILFLGAGVIGFKVLRR